MTIRVLIADDDALLRAGVAVVLGTAEDIDLVGEAADGLEAVEMCRSLGPDVVLMDVRMPGIDGIEATRRIVSAGLASRVLVLTTFQHDEYVWGALRAGGSGFLLKRSPPELLINAVRTVAAGDALLDPSVTRDLIKHFVNSDFGGAGSHGAGPHGAGPRGAGPQGVGSRGAGSRGWPQGAQQLRLAQLTPRESQVLRLVAEGYSNQEIAELLVIAESTAKTHVKRVLVKVGARDRAQAVVIAYQGGLMNSPT